jgi:hypothetical protein
MRYDASRFDIRVGFRHHFSKGRVGFDPVEALFHVRIKLDSFAYDYTSIAIAVGCKFFE